MASTKQTEIGPVLTEAVTTISVEQPVCSVVQASLVILLVPHSAWVYGAVLPTEGMAKAQVRELCQSHMAGQWQG